MNIIIAARRQAVRYGESLASTPPDQYVAMIKAWAAFLAQFSFDEILWDYLAEAKVHGQYGIGASSKTIPTPTERTVYPCPSIDDTKTVDPKTLS